MEQGNGSNLRSGPPALSNNKTIYTPDRRLERKGSLDSRSLAWQALERDREREGEVGSQAREWGNPLRASTRSRSKGIPV